MQTRESVMRHALGLSAANLIPYRNHYAYDPASTSGAIIHGLIEDGLMVHAKDPTLHQEHGLSNAHVTVRGATALGLQACETVPGAIEVNGCMVPTFDA